MKMTFRLLGLALMAVFMTACSGSDDEQEPQISFGQEALEFTAYSGDWYKITDGYVWEEQLDNGWRVTYPDVSWSMVSIRAKFKKSGNVTIDFDWGINRTYPEWGKFELYFYVDDELYFTEKHFSADTAGELLTHASIRIPNVEADNTIIKWGIKCTELGIWSDPEGRKGAIGNIKVIYE